MVDQGATYSHTFTKPGRFEYVCLPHREFMKGVIQVGQDTVAVSYKGAKTSVRGRKATTRYQLLEAASVTAVARGPKKLRVTVKRAEAGKGSVAWGKKLPAGRYKGTLTFVDDFDKKSVKQVGFRMPLTARTISSRARPSAGVSPRSSHSSASPSSAAITATPAASAAARLHAGVLQQPFEGRAPERAHGAHRRARLGLGHRRGGQVEVDARQALVALEHAPEPVEHAPHDVLDGARALQLAQHLGR